VILLITGPGALIADKAGGTARRLNAWVVIVAQLPAQLARLTTDVLDQRTCGHSADDALEMAEQTEV
jgi:hypothetical protein